MALLLAGITIFCVVHLFKAVAPAARDNLIFKLGENPYKGIFSLLILGIGAGYLEPEFRALGIPFAQRGARTDECIAAMQALWTQPKPSFEGKYTRFSHIDAQPRPVQAAGPPIVVKLRLASRVIR